MKNIFVGCVIFLFLCNMVSPAHSSQKMLDAAAKHKIICKTNSLQMPFVENRGQVSDENVLFFSCTFGGTMFIDKKGVLEYGLFSENGTPIVLKEFFNSDCHNVSGVDPSSTVVNYFKGNDKSNWLTNVSTYNSVDIHDVFIGVDLKLKAYNSNVEKIFTVKPHKSPKQIEIGFIGATEIRINQNGELEVVVGSDVVKFTKPVAFQEINNSKQSIEVAYAVYDKTTYGFTVGQYDLNKPLIIDPLLISTFIGHNNYDWGVNIALDSNGDVFVTGGAFSWLYPVINGYDITHNGLYTSDVIVSKFNSDLTTLESSTFIGGTNEESGYDIAIDSNDNIFVTGITNSTDFPATGYNGGESDAFVAKLNNSLSSLNACTFIGGLLKDGTSNIAIDSTDNVFITGGTYSSNFPNGITTGVYGSYSGDSDAFISKFSNSLTHLATRFIGKSGKDIGWALNFDSGNNIFIVGTTGSTDFDTTTVGYNESYKGGANDIFISKYSNALNIPPYASKLIGSSDNDTATDITLDPSGNIYLVGTTYGNDYKVTSGVYRETYYSGNSGDVIVSKFSNNLNTLIASTYIGGTEPDFGHAISFGADGHVYLAGRTMSADFPTTIASGAYDPTYNGDGTEGVIVDIRGDAFVTRLDSGLEDLLKGTFIGGAQGEAAFGMVLNNDDIIYITGVTESTDYPTSGTSGNTPYQSSHAGNADVMISKLQFADELPPPLVPALSELGIILFMGFILLVGIISLKKKQIS